MGIRGDIAADLARFDSPWWATLLREPQHRWLALYRVADAATSWRRAVLAQVVKRYGRRFGYTIPLGTLGRSLRLPHFGLLIINGAARVGDNCQICQGVTLGATDRGAPTIGSDVFIGPNVTVVGPTRVGDGAVLAAGSNVRSDVLAGAVVRPRDDVKTEDYAAQA